MLVEHTFITTQSADDAARAAATLLLGRGFQLDAEAPIGGGAALNMRRGKKNPARAASVVELPQQVRLEWDRGRVIVAVSLTPKEAAALWNTRARRPRPDQQNMLLAIAHALEMCLAHGAPPEECYKLWDEVESRVGTRSRKAYRMMWILAVVICVVGVAALVTVLVVTSRPR